MHEPEGRLSDVVPDASQIMAGTGLPGDETTAGSWVRIVEGSVPRVGMYVCLEFYAVAARLEEHMPELVRVGQSWGRGGPKEQPKSDLMGKRARRGRRGRPSQGTKREISAACDAPAAPWRPWTLGAVYRGVALKLYGLSSSARTPDGARLRVLGP